MGVLSPEELVRLWSSEQLPTERAIGQIVQHLARLQATLDQHGQALARLRTDVARLHEPATSESSVPRKRPPRKS